MNVDSAESFLKALASDDREINLVKTIDLQYQDLPSFTQKIINGNLHSIYGLRIPETSKVTEVVIRDAVITTPTLEGLLGDVTFERVDFSGASVVVHPMGDERNGRLSFQHCLFYKLVERGLRIHNTDGLKIEYCVFDACGWDSEKGRAADGQRSYFDQYDGSNLYVHPSCTDLILDHCVLSRSSYAGALAGNGGTITNNLCINNPVGLHVGESMGEFGDMEPATASVMNNVILGGADMYDAERGEKIVVQRIKAGMFQNNRFAGIYRSDVGCCFYLDGRFASVTGIILKDNQYSFDTKFIRQDGDVEEPMLIDNKQVIRYDIVKVRNAEIYNVVYDLLKEGEWKKDKAVIENLVAEHAKAVESLD